MDIRSSKLEQPKRNSSKGDRAIDSIAFCLWCRFTCTVGCKAGGMVGYMYYVFARGCLHLNPRPRTESDRGYRMSLERDIFIFQSTLSHGERRVIREAVVVDTYFNPRSRTESDFYTIIKRATSSPFQSTLSHGERLIH